MISRMNRVRFSSEPPYLPGPRPGRQQLVEQVAMALLDVDEVEADPEGQPGRLDVAVLEAVELVVGDEGIIGAGGPSRWPCRRRCGDRAAGRAGPGAAVGTSSGRSGSAAGRRAGRRRGRSPRRWACRRLAEHPLEGRGGGSADDELAGIGPAFRDDRGGLAPDQLGPAGAEAAVAAEGQLARAAVGLAVAALHRLDRQPVADAPAADLDRPEAAARGRRPARGPGPAPARRRAGPRRVLYLK